MRLSRCDVRDHINYRKNDRWPSYRFYRALQRLKSPMRYICEIFGAPRFSSFSTQQFNLHGSSHAQRLAQFEREVASKRIRDKIAASKRKGLRVGGPLPLGYEMNDGKIAAIEEEAERVRLIFRRCLELGELMHWCEISGSRISERRQDDPRRVLFGRVAPLK